MSQKPESFGPHIVQCSADESLCAGCSACEIVCGLVHDGSSSPSLRRIFLKRDTCELIHTIYACQQCVDAPCYNACPKKDTAMCIDKERSIVYINAEHCIGCKLCIKACPFEPKRIQMNLDSPRPKAIKCDLCRNRPGGPACVEYCQVLCLSVEGGANGQEAQT